MFSGMAGGKCFVTQVSNSCKGDSTCKTPTLKKGNELQRNRKRKWAPNPTAHSIALFKTPLSPPRTPNALPQLYLLVSVIVPSSLSLSLVSVLVVDLRPQHIQWHSSNSIITATNSKHIATSLSLSFSMSVFASRSLFVSLFLLLIDLRQCPVQRTPNRTTKHIQKIIYGKISSGISRHCPHRQTCCLYI
jgi:hypothetical protein